MTPKVVETQLRTFVDTMVGNGLALSSNPVVSWREGENTMVSWSKTASLSATFGRFACIDEYTTFLDNRDYSLVLQDGALLQFSYTFKANDLVGHRLCHYPCPISIADLDADDGSIVEWIEALSGEELRSRLRLRTPLRLDFDPKAAKANHPATHFTISEDTCRIPVAAPISLAHFVGLVFEHFYPSAWATYSFLREVAHHHWDDTVGQLEANRVFVGWRRHAIPASTEVSAASGRSKK